MMGVSECIFSLIRRGIKWPGWIVYSTLSFPKAQSDKECRLSPAFKTEPPSWASTRLTNVTILSTIMEKSIFYIANQRWTLSHDMLALCKHVWTACGRCELHCGTELLAVSFSMGCT